MRWAKNWGTVSSGAELYMLAHAEHTRKRLAKKKPTPKRRLPLASQAPLLQQRSRMKGGVVICHEINTKTTIIR